MAQHTLKKLPKNTVEIVVSVPWDEVQKHYTAAFDNLQKDLTIEGFRKGKAPKAIAEKHLSKDQVYHKMVNVMLPAIYEDIIREESLKPIVSPRIELVKAKENEDWEFKITIAEKSTIDLKDYKKKVQEINSVSKKAEIWVPTSGEPSAGKPEKNKEEDKQKNLNTILTALLESISIEISDLVVEEELNQRLSRLLDDIQKLGLTAEAYLKSKNTTMDELRNRMKKEIEDTYKIEFILAEIAEKENITVDQKDIDVLFSHIKDEKERKSAQENAYFYASVLRKQKTLEYLGGL